MHALTDVTGFGLLGHGFEMAERSGVTVVFDASTLPLYPGALRAAEAGVRTGGDARNRRYLDGRVVEEHNQRSRRSPTTPRPLEACCALWRPKPLTRSLKPGSSSSATWPRGRPASCSGREVSGSIPKGRVRKSEHDRGQFELPAVAIRARAGRGGGRESNPPSWVCHDRPL